MILALCMKDIRANMNWWLLVVFFYLLYAVQFFEFLPLYIITGFLPGIILTAIVLINEDRYKTEVLYSSLPVTRMQIVLSRYLLVSALMFFCVVLNSGLTIILDGCYGNDVPGFNPLTKSAVAASAFIIPLFIVYAFLPFYYRYGLYSGAGRFFLISFLAIVAAAEGINLTGYLLYSQRYNARLLFKIFTAFAAFSFKVFAVMNSVFYILLSAAMLLILTLLAALSLGLSAGVFKRREL